MLSFASAANAIEGWLKAIVSSQRPTLAMARNEWAATTCEENRSPGRGLARSSIH